MTAKGCRRAAAPMQRPHVGCTTIAAQRPEAFLPTRLSVKISDSPAGENATEV